MIHHILKGELKEYFNKGQNLNICFHPDLFIYI